MRDALWIVGFILAVAPAAHAQTDNEDEARTAFKEGLNAFDEGRTSDALVSFQRAYSLRPAFKLLYNIGQAQTELGLTRQAIQSFERYLQEGKDKIPPDRKLQVEAELSRLRILAGVKPVDTAPAASEAPPTPPPKDTAPTEENKFMAKVAPWMFGGLALATTGVGVAMGVRALSLNKSLNSSCTDGGCPPQYEEDIDSQKGSAVAADVLIITGTLLTAATISIVAVVRHKKKGASK